MRCEQTRTDNPWGISEAQSDGTTRPIVPPVCPLKTAFSFAHPGIRTARLAVEIFFGAG